MTVLRLSTALGLSDEQWQRFEAVLLKETRPPRFTTPRGPTGYFQFVYQQMRRIPPEKLQPIFEPWQWKIVKTKVEEAGGFANAGQAKGLISEEE